MKKLWKTKKLWPFQQAKRNVKFKNLNRNSIIFFMVKEIS